MRLRKIIGGSVVSKLLDDLLIEPHGWQLFAVAHHSDGRWYCCFRKGDRAAVAYADTAQEAYDNAHEKAIEMTDDQHSPCR